ncbi:MAG: hypothetical protein LHV69_09465 [Elusimicrobia bacterium]|nr:hypothetical protein [Candidatus Obscuribacterium magneticum]
MNLSWQKGLSIVVLISFTTTQVVLGSIAEANFWKDRQKSLSQCKKEPSSSPLASLPSSLSPGSRPFQNLVEDLPKLWTKAAQKKFRHIPEKLRGLINSVPFGFARLQEVYDSGHPENPALVIIQDVHLNSEAQGNISKILQGLIDQRKVDLVAVEGAFEPFDFSRFRIFPDKKIVGEVAKAFLDKNLLAAPSYVGLTSTENPPPFIGVDDRIHYDANVGAYLSSRPLKDKVSKKLRQTDRSLREEKEKVFSKSLKAFDDLRSAHQKGDLGLGAYVEKLVEFLPRKDEGSRVSDGVLGQFLEAYRIETTLGFNRVEMERTSVLEKLAGKLNEKELEGLVAESLAYRMGRLSFGDYYENLKALCLNKGIDLKKTPAFESYIRYVLLADGINSNDLLDSIQAVEEEIKTALVKTPEEKTLIDFSEYLSLVGKLVGFSLTPKEWGEYKNSRHSRESSPRRTFGNDGSLSSFESFYREADIRSELMVKKLLGVEMEKGKGGRPRDPTFGFVGSRGLPPFSSSILITGGFHTPEISQILKDKSISFIVVAPKISKIDDPTGTSYLSIFAREKTPLDRLFAGETLFLTPEEGHATFGPTRNRFLTEAVHATVFGLPVSVGNGIILDPQMGGRRVESDLSRADVGDLTTYKSSRSSVPGLILEGPGVLGGNIFVKKPLGKGILGSLILGAAWLETRGFHDAGFGWGLDLLTGFGVDLVTAGLLGAVAIGFLFSFSHTIVAWLTGAKQDHWVRDLFVRWGFSLLFNLPFLPFMPSYITQNAVWISFGSHAAVNAIVLVGRWQNIFLSLKKFFKEFPLMAMLGDGAEDLGPDDFVIPYTIGLLESGDQGLREEGLGRYISLREEERALVMAGLEPGDRDGLDIELRQRGLIYYFISEGLTQETWSEFVDFLNGRRDPPPTVVHPSPFINGFFGWFDLFDKKTEFVFTLEETGRRIWPSVVYIPSLSNQALSVGVNRNQAVWIHAGSFWYRIWVEVQGENRLLNIQQFRQIYGRPNADPVSLSELGEAWPGPYHVARNSHAAYNVRDSQISRTHFSVEVRPGIPSLGGEFTLRIEAAATKNGTRALCEPDPVQGGPPNFVAEDVKVDPLPEDVKSEVKRSAHKPIFRFSPTEIARACKRALGQICQLFEASPLDIDSPGPSGSQLDEIIQREFLGVSASPADQRRVKRIAGLIFEARKRHVRLIFDREFDNANLASVEFILDAIRRTPVELLRRSPDLYEIRLSHIVDDPFLSQLVLGPVMADQIGEEDLDPILRIKTAVAYELVRQMAVRSNGGEGDALDLLLPIADWVDLLELQGMTSVVLPSGGLENVRDFLDVRQSGGRPAVIEKIRGLKGPSFQGFEDVDEDDPLEIVAWNALSQGQGFGRDQEGVEQILDRHFRRNGDTVYRFNATTGFWGAKPMEPQSPATAGPDFNNGQSLPGAGPAFIFEPLWRLIDFKTPLGQAIFWGLYLPVTLLIAPALENWIFFAETPDRVHLAVKGILFIFAHIVVLGIVRAAKKLFPLAVAARAKDTSYWLKKEDRFIIPCLIAVTIIIVAPFVFVSDQKLAFKIALGIHMAFNSVMVWRKERILNKAIQAASDKLAEDVFSFLDGPFAFKEFITAHYWARGDLEQVEDVYPGLVDIMSAFVDSTRSLEEMDLRRTLHRGLYHRVLLRAKKKVQLLMKGTRLFYLSGYYKANGTREVYLRIPIRKNQRIHIFYGEKLIEYEILDEDGSEKIVALDGPNNPRQIYSLSRHPSDLHKFPLETRYPVGGSRSIRFSKDPNGVYYLEVWDQGSHVGTFVQCVPKEMKDQPHESQASEVKVLNDFEARSLLDEAAAFPHNKTDGVLFIHGDFGIEEIETETSAVPLEEAEFLLSGHAICAVECRGVRFFVWSKMIPPPIELIKNSKILKRPSRSPVMSLLGNKGLVETIVHRNQEVRFRFDGPFGILVRGRKFRVMGKNTQQVGPTYSIRQEFDSGSGEWLTLQDGEEFDVTKTGGSLSIDFNTQTAIIKGDRDNSIHLHLPGDFYPVLREEVSKRARRHVLNISFLLRAVEISTFIPFTIQSVLRFFESHTWLEWGSFVLMVLVGFHVVWYGDYKSGEAGESRAQHKDSFIHPPSPEVPSMTASPYNLSRHPVYAATHIFIFGLFLINPTWIQAVGGILWWGVIWLAALTHERAILLSKSPSVRQKYQSYTSKVPLFPRMSYVILNLLIFLAVFSYVHPNWAFKIFHNLIWVISGAVVVIGAALSGLFGGRPHPTFRDVIGVVPLDRPVRVLCLCAMNWDRSPTMESALHSVAGWHGLGDMIEVRSRGAIGGSGHINDAWVDAFRSWNMWHSLSPSRIAIKEDYQWADVILIVDDDNWRYSERLYGTAFTEEHEYKVFNFATLYPQAFPRLNYVPDSGVVENLKKTVMKMFQTIGNAIIPLLSERAEKIKQTQSGTVAGVSRERGGDTLPIPGVSPGDLGKMRGILKGLVKKGGENSEKFIRLLLAFLRHKPFKEIELEEIAAIIESVDWLTDDDLSLIFRDIQNDSTGILSLVPPEETQLPGIVKSYLHLIQKVVSGEASNGAGLLFWVRELLGMDKAKYRKRAVGIENASVIIGLVATFILGFIAPQLLGDLPSTLQMVHMHLWLIFFDLHIFDFVLNLWRPVKERAPPENMLAAALISLINIHLGFLFLSSSFFSVLLVSVLGLAVHWGVNKVLDKEDLAEIIKANKNNKRKLLVALLNFFRPRERGINLSERVIGEEGDEPLSAESVKTQIISTLQAMLRRGEITQAEFRDVGETCAVVFSLVFTEEEYRGFVGSFKELERLGDETEVQEEILYVSSDLSIAIRQVTDGLKPLVKKGRWTSSTLLTVVVPGSVEPLREALLVRFGTAANRILIIDGRAQPNVKGLFMDKTYRKNRSEGGKLRRDLTRRFILWEDSSLPPDYFDSADLERDPELKPLAETVHIYFILETLQLAVEIPRSHLPHWQAFRKALLSV